MKKALLILTLLSHIPGILHGQNIPSGVNAPAPPTTPLIDIPAPIGVWGLNFTRTFVPLKPISDLSDPILTFAPSSSGSGTSGYYQAKVVTNYTNGWGRSIESIVRGGWSTPDLLTVYDNRASLTKNGFLPYPLPISSTFQGDPVADQQAYYTTNYPDENGFSYSQSVTSYPSSVPTTQSYAPGSSFVGNLVGTTVSKTFNDGTENIIMYTASSSTTAEGTFVPVASGTYAAGALSVKTTVKPDDGKTIEYFDRDGQEICKQVYAGADGSGPIMLTTYYVYNNENKLTNIITPKGTKALAASPSADVSALTYSYAYNAYGSPIAQNMPGKMGADYTIYDSRNRPVLIQTPLLRSYGKYKFNIYDSRDRIVISGLLSDPDNTYDVWQNAVNGGATSLWSSPLDLLCYFLHDVHEPYPTFIRHCEIEQVNFYDNYDALSRPFDDSYEGYYSYADQDVLPEPYMVTQGLPTASLARIRDGGMDESDDLWTCSVYFYDQKGRVIQTQTLNAFHAQDYATCMSGAPLEAWDVLTTQYNFTGQKILDILFYNDVSESDKPSTQIVNQYFYDLHNGNRFQGIMQSIDDGAAALISDYRYDDLGRVIKKSLGGVEIQNYDYNIRGQLTGINRDYAMHPCGATTATFGCILDYDFGFSEPRFDGNISGIMWRGASSTVPLRAYGYEYDPAGRLIDAEFRQYCDAGTSAVACGSSSLLYSWNKDKADFTASEINYDENGNLRAMKQRGTTATGPVDMDKLTYSYFPNTNTLTTVADAVTTNYHLGDFQDVTPDCAHGEAGRGASPEGFIGSPTVRGPGNCSDYAYDADGNLAADLNKGIANIVYNEMDQPLTVTYTAGKAIHNMYTANGTLINKRINPGTGAPTIYRYLGPFTYSRTASSITATDHLQYVLHDEGRARFDAVTGLFTYDYFVKDHLGNVRTVVTGNVTNAPLGSTTVGVETSMGGATAERTYVATHEVDVAGLEEIVFTNIDKVREDRPDNTDTTDVKGARTNSNDTSRQVGTSILLKVMAGDEFDLSAQSFWYNDSTVQSDTSNELLNAIISMLAGAKNNTSLLGEAGPTRVDERALTNDMYEEYKTLLTSITDPDAPAAYLNYLVFDENMNLLPDQCGAIQVGATPDDWQAIGIPAPLKILASGYLAVYISNATPINVFFDHVTVTLTPSRLIQEQHYYPFGLTINEGESGTVVRNKFKYQGKELMDEANLNLYDFTARQYDPQIGRFWGLDPASQFPSGYTGMGNNPSNMVDPSGCIASQIRTDPYTGRDPRMLPSPMAAMDEKAMNDEFRGGYNSFGVLQAQNQEKSGGTGDGKDAEQTTKYGGVVLTTEYLTAKADVQPPLSPDAPTNDAPTELLPSETNESGAQGCDNVTPNMYTGGVIVGNTPFYNFMVNSAGGARNQNGDRCEVAAWQVYDPKCTEYVYIIQPWYANYTKNGVAYSNNSADVVTEFGFDVNNIRSQIHTHMDSNPPSNWKQTYGEDYNDSQKWNKPVMTIGPDGIMWKIRYPDIPPASCVDVTYKYK